MKRLFFRLLFVGLCLAGITQTSFAATSATSLRSEHTALSTETDSVALTVGQERLDEVSDLETSLNTLKTDITNYTTSLGGTIESNGTITGMAEEDDAERILLESLWADHTTLINKVADFTPIANTQKACLEGLIDLAKLKTFRGNTQTAAELETANDTAITDAKTTVDPAVITAQAIEDAGVGNVGGLKTSESNTEFTLEFGRLKLTDELADLVTGLPALNTALTAAQDAMPKQHTIVTGLYDTALLAAQSNVETAATALKLAADAAALKAIAIVGTDGDTDDSDANPIPLQAEIVRDMVNAFGSRANFYLNQALHIRSQISLRTRQREYLFDTLTDSQKNTKLSEIQTLLTQQATNATNQSDALADLSALLDADIPAFPEDPVDETAGGVSAVEQRILTQLTRPVNPDIKQDKGGEITQIRELIKNSKDTNGDPIDPPPASIVEAHIDAITPRLLVLAAAREMHAFIDMRVPNSALLRYNAEAPGDDKAAKLIELEAEWNEYVALMQTYIADPAVDTLVDGENYRDEINKLLTESPHNRYFLPLFTGVTGTAKPSRNFQIKLNRARRTTGKIKTHAISLRVGSIREFIAKYITPEGKLLPPATPENTANTAQNTRPETNNDDFAGEDLITTNSLTRSPLADGTQILLAGPDASLGDPVLASGLDKLTADIKVFLKESAQYNLLANVEPTSGGNSPNVLGGTGDESTSIQIIADGNCKVIVHNDILITGSKPILGTSRFGKGDEGHRITFFSHTPKEIRVKRGVVWDLGDFGNTLSGRELGSDFDDTTTYKKFGKQVAFGGKIRLVFEPQSGIRFPKVEQGKEGQGVVLYMNDESEIIFEKDSNDEVRIYQGETLTGSDCVRNKIYGMGQIWVSKGATMTVQDNAMVGIEADYTTPLTDITLSLQGGGRVNIGNGSSRGGALQVGNMFDGGSKKVPDTDDDNWPNIARDGFTPRQTFINFALKISNPKEIQSVFSIGRNGFLGFAAGIINKSGTINATTQTINDVEVTSPAWQVQRLYNVGSITCDIEDGILEHNQIASGSDTSNNGSLLAIGPLLNYPAGKYLLRLGSSDNAFIRGGGNILLVDKDAGIVVDANGALVTDDTLDFYTNPYTVVLSDTVESLVVDDTGTTNTGKFSILAPSKTIRTNRQEASYSDNSTQTTTYFYGRGFVHPQRNSYGLAAPHEEFFQALSMPDILTETKKKVAVGYGGTGISTAMGYISGNTIQRRSADNITTINLEPSSFRPKDALSSAGQMTVTSTSDKPTKFKQSFEG